MGVEKGEAERGSVAIQVVSFLAQPVLPAKAGIDRL